MSETPKLFQNRVSESGSTLLVAAVYALVIWAAAGVVTHGWWLQMACMGLTTYIIVELTNTNALLRVRSRMISSTFLVLGCSANFLFPSLSGALASLLFTASLIPFFNSYQKANTQRELYVAFLAIGAASISDVVILWLVPVLWLLCFTQLQSLSRRSWTASLLGLLTPYWCLLPVLIFTGRWNLLTEHIAGVYTFQFPVRFDIFSPQVLLTAVFVTILMAIGQVHFWYKSFEDRIHIRHLYGFLGLISWTSIALLLFQPQHYDLMLRILIICGSSFVAHFFIHTRTKLTNILFVGLLVVAVAIAVLNLLV